MYHFTSDLHLGSEEIIMRENRPFDCMRDFIGFIIKQFNKQIKYDDKIIIVGDYLNYNGKINSH